MVKIVRMLVQLEDHVCLLLIKKQQRPSLYLVPDSEIMRYLGERSKNMQWLLPYHLNLCMFY